MTGPKPRIWTTSRKLWGNLFPFLVGLAAGYASWALFMHPSPDAWLTALPWFIGASWIALVFHAYTLNRTMRSELSALVSAPAHAHFVGFATPSYKGLLDTHEDVGFLWWDEEAMHYRGERLSIDLPRASIHLVRYRATIHTWVALGGWISVEGELDGKQVRLLAESREARTMIGGHLATIQLIRQVRGWLASYEKSPGGTPGAAGTTSRQEGEPEP